METLGYIYCAAAYEESSPIESVASIEKARVSDGLNWKKFSMQAWFYLLPLTIVLGIFTVPQEAQAYVRHGSRGYKVVKVQNRLRSRGYFPKYVPSTGYYGPVTKIGVRYFQRHAGLRVDGIVGPKTARALGLRHYRHVRRYRKVYACSCSPSHVHHKHHHRYHRYHGRTIAFRDRGNDVAWLQKRLKRSGYFYSKRTGYFGTRTANAVIRFQKANGLYVDGVVGPRTRAALRYY